MNDLMTKSFLNYVELKKQALKDLEAGPDLEMASLSHADEQNLAQFFNEVGIIKTEMEEITSLLLDLQDLHKEKKSMHSPKVLRGLRDRMDSDMVTILRKAKIIKLRLESLDRSNLTNRNISWEYKEGTPVDRTRVSVANGLRTKLREMMMDFQSLRERILDEYKEDLNMRYFNQTGKELSKETIEKMVLGGDQIGVFEKEKKLPLDLENQEKEEAVKQIQRSLMELHQVFLDMAILVEAQGEQMDDIEHNVACAGNYINGGTNSLAKVATKNKSRKEWACHGAWALVLILVLVCLIWASS
ncbi:syntaxin-112-like [Tasmannia lanceolata]|uniref:syntaxin-112-like n=1 Tax=Tasmannia lanceolata TaxID=3420 RepID=UPI004064A52B